MTNDEIQYWSKIERERDALYRLYSTLKASQGRWDETTLALLRGPFENADKLLSGVE